MKRTVFFLTLILCTVPFVLFFSCVETAQLATVGEQPKFDQFETAVCEQTEEIDSLLCTLSFRSNTPNARIFLNGEYQGNTELTVKNISEGRYHLTVEKKGFKRADFFIDARRGRHDSFYIPLD